MPPARPMENEESGWTHLKTRSSRQAMRRALKAHATITAAFRVGRSRRRVEMRVTKASPLLLELPPPAAPTPGPVEFPGPGPGGGRSWRSGSGCGAGADSALRARAAGAARSASNSSGSSSRAGGGAARIVWTGGSGRAATPGPHQRKACARAPAAEATARCWAGSCGARKSPRRRHQHVARSHSTGFSPAWAGQAISRVGAALHLLMARVPLD